MEFQILAKKFDVCHVCGGNSSTCAGCDGVPNSGLVFDACNVCGGYNDTCGCDGKCGKLDSCGVCNGDDSSCMCVSYHGFTTSEMEYLLTKYTIDQTLQKSKRIIWELNLLLEIISNYNGNADIGTIIYYFNNFCKGCLKDYSNFLDSFVDDLKSKLGTQI